MDLSGGERKVGGDGDGGMGAKESGAVVYGKALVGYKVAGC